MSQDEAKPQGDSCEAKLLAKASRRAQAAELVNSAHAIAEHFQAKSRKAQWRKWNPDDDGSLGFQYGNGCKSECNCGKTPQLLPTESAFPKMTQPKGMLCPLGGLVQVNRGQLNAVPASKTTWEKFTLCVDSGASDTVIPPHMLSWIEMVATSKVGQAYEVANGEEVHNLGQRKALMKISLASQSELELDFQVVTDVHKPLLAVSSVVRRGHEVIFSEKNPRIVLSNGETIPMRHQNGTYEVDIWVQKPSFIRLSTE